MTDTDMGGMCSCDIFDGWPAVYDLTIRKARKTHRCYECNRSIEPGERYEDVKSLFDGIWDRFRTHLSCAGIRRDFCCNVHGSVGETFHETYGFSPWEHVEDDDDEN